MGFLCDRPHARVVDFETERFVVSIASGLDTSIGHLNRGQELPSGLLDSRTLRIEYEHHKIQLVRHAKNDPLLSEACALNGVVLEDAPEQASQETPDQAAPAPRTKVLDDLEKMDRAKLVVLCRKFNLSTDGSKTELCARLSSVVV